MEFTVDFDREVLSLWSRFKCEFGGWNYAKNRQTSKEFYKNEEKSKGVTIMKCRIES